MSVGEPIRAEINGLHKIDKHPGVEWPVAKLLFLLLEMRLHPGTGLPPYAEQEYRHHPRIVKIGLQHSQTLGSPVQVRLHPNFEHPCLTFKGLTPADRAYRPSKRDLWNATVAWHTPHLTRSYSHDINTVRFVLPCSIRPRQPHSKPKRNL